MSVLNTKYGMLIVATVLVAACACGVEERTALTYANGKVLSHPRVLERTAGSARIVHDAGVGTFYKHEFDADAWAWIQGCELGSFQTRATAAEPEEAAPKRWLRRLAHTSPPRPKDRTNGS